MCNISVSKGKNREPGDVGTPKRCCYCWGKPATHFLSTPEHPRTGHCLCGKCAGHWQKPDAEFAFGGKPLLRELHKAEQMIPRPAKPKAPKEPAKQESMV